MPGRINRLSNDEGASDSAEKRRELKVLAAKILAEGGQDRDQTLKLLAESLKSPLRDFGLLKALYSLSQQLLPRSNDFAVIVSDEASGRIPSLLVKELFDRVRLNRGETKIPITFLLGGYTLPQQKAKVADFVAGHKGELEQALIVSEFMMSGESMANTLEDFHRQGLDPTVAAVSTWYKKGEYKRLASDKLVIGVDDDNIGATRLWGETTSSGVVKLETSPGPHPESTKLVKKGNDLHDMSEIDFAEPVQKDIALARGEIYLVAEVFFGMLASPPKQSWLQRLKNGGKE